MPALKITARHKYRVACPDYFHYESWLNEMGAGGWILRAIDSDGVHIFSKASGKHAAAGKEEL